MNGSPAPDAPPPREPAPPILKATMGRSTVDRTVPDRPVPTFDLYELTAARLDGCRGLILSLDCDQVFLSERADLLADWVRGGGRVLVNGHVNRPFLPGLAPWRRLDHRGPRDLRITPVTPHPIWAGVDFDELLYRTGVPGTPTGEELARVGVAGFYGRGYHGALPEDATVINGIGPYRLPIDISYPLGAGAVLAHAGNDLLSFSDHDRTTRHLGARLLHWLEGPR
ncbi:hypothetical protein [Streptomyces sp. NPDC059816]|uniref:hypothetical protein n=1 Tax=Streptomyces sp. NPDC059816 TaxID=3346960 RepID=UPI003667503B